MKAKTYAEELIGKTIKVVKSTNPGQEGWSGKVLDETKKTLVVKTAQGEKRLLKSNITIIIDEKKVEGKELLKRPEERIK